MDDFGIDDNSSSGSGTSDILSSLFSSAASVVNTYQIANANPVNAAIITGTPISTPSISVGSTGFATTMTPGTWLLLGALVIGGAFLVAAQR